MCIRDSSFSAVAADLPVRYNKAPVAMEPAWNWSGFYGGVNIGYGVTRSPTTNDTVFTNDFDPVTSSSANLAAGGVVGGVQIGYNWQFSPTWLFGIEADIQG